MAKWKLSRQTFGRDEYDLTEGDEVTIGRGVDNKISLSSIVVSRNHCILNVKKDEVSITDLKSSNGVYVGLKRIQANVPYALTDSDIIGFGWTAGVPLAKVNDHEKFVFKLMRNVTSITNRIQFQSESECEDTENELSPNKCPKKLSPNVKIIPSPVLNTKPDLKRKLSQNHNMPAIKKEPNEINQNHTHIKENINNIIDISDSETESCNVQHSGGVAKKIKKEIEDSHNQDKAEFKQDTNSVINIITDSDNECHNTHQNLLTEKHSRADIKYEDLEFEAFKVKQEHSGYEEEPLEIISDSDSDSESQQWYLRLSQSSPGKPFVKAEKQEHGSNRPNIYPEDSNYSQLDDDIIILDNKEEDNEEDEEFADDLIQIPLIPPEDVPNKNEEKQALTILKDKEREIMKLVPAFENDKDVVDDMDTNNDTSETEKAITPVASVPKQSEISRKIQIIEPLVHTSKRKTNDHISNNKSKSLHKHSKTKKYSSSSRINITNSQKEERKKKLKEIASKNKEDVEDESNKNSINNVNKSVSNVKFTTSNRGAFLTDIVQATVKPIKRKDSISTNKEKKHSNSESKIKQSNAKMNKKNKSEKSIPIDETIKHSEVKRKSNVNKSQNSLKTNDLEERKSIKSVKPLTESVESLSGKPISKVEPLPPKKPKKSVRFSATAPIVHEFEIEPGNKLKKTSSVKTSLVDIATSRPTTTFSLEKITLMKILRWNPQWLNEQKTNAEPPPILGHNNPPLVIFHSFNSHNQYIGLVGDLLLMEIWECVTQAHLRITQNKTYALQLRIESMPPVASYDQSLELFNLSVNVSMPTSEVKNLPRKGEIMVVEFGPENDKTSRFFFVHNVKTLPSPPYNKMSFFSLSLYATFTRKMSHLTIGQLMIGKTLVYINKELMLFEAMERMSVSPLSEAILKPQPHHFPKIERNVAINLKSQWTKTLNPSQKEAVSCSVSAALGDRPSIQMVQGPPGTGKSSVICAMVMTYFYDASGKKYQDRGKILICATSNAAVDELVIRLLNIRQSLPRAERFRMVRVGRLEAMHDRARDVSSQELAQRDATRLVDSSRAGVTEEISHLEAKINMWKTAEKEAKDPVRVAYCQSRTAILEDRIALIRNGDGGGGTNEGVRPERLMQAELRVIERADIIVTTLASAQNYKMKGLKGRIALCIVDEAGQAIEPETLIPLTLQVTRLTLIGDPQQLPGFICSQRAKRHGLGGSLFSRLTSCTEQWSASPVVLLDQQYRMHPTIADYPNRAFYAGRVRSVPPPPVELPVPPYTILAIASGDRAQGCVGVNEIEAWGVARVAAALAGVRGKLSLALLSPYSGQCDQLRNCLKTLMDPSSPPVEVSTVDSFQGQERDVVIVSLARSHGVGFLTDAGRMNVMLTRARHALIVCLNPLAIVKNNQWQSLVDDARRRNLYRVLPGHMCQPASVAKIPTDEALKYIRTNPDSYQRK